MTSAFALFVWVWGFFHRSKEIKFTLQMNQGSNPYWKIKGFYHNGELQHRVRRQGELCNVPQSPKEKKCTPKLLSDVAIGTSCPCGEEVHREPANAHVLLQARCTEPSVFFACCHNHWIAIFSLLHLRNTVFLSNLKEYRQWYRKQVSEGLYRQAFFPFWCENVEKNVIIYIAFVLEVKTCF